jgi:hypothetical protein
MSTPNENGKTVDFNVTPRIDASLAQPQGDTTLDTSSAQAQQPTEPTVRETGSPVKRIDQSTLDNTNRIVPTSVEEKPDPTKINPTVPQTQLTYEEMVKRLSPYRPKTPEEIEAERKKYKRRATFAALGDGLSAMANLFFTTKGAPNAWNPANSMSERMNTRLEQLRQEREQNAKLYFEQYLRARQQDKADAIQAAAAKRQKERDDENDRRQAVIEARQDAKDKWEFMTKQLQNAYLEGKIQAQQYDAERKRIDAEYEAEVKKSIINKNNRTGTGGGKKTVLDETNGVRWYDSEGNEHFAKNVDIARTNSIPNGTWHEDTKTSTSTQTKKTDDGTEVTTREIKTQGKGHSEPPKKQGGSEKDNYKRGGNTSSNQQQTQKKNKAPLS